ncbi:MAG: exodeoxyribonuclease VII small subunit [Chloroflexi bacterium]|nr:exodeoxyribonuclease VII small subunit [Chloroflexota bacterium]
MASKKTVGEGFEALYRRLEETVARLEEGGLTLEESLALYEEGMRLARRCQELLREAELRVTRLQESFTEGLGTLREEPGDYLETEEAGVSAQDEPPME